MKHRIYCAALAAAAMVVAGCSSGSGPSQHSNTSSGSASQAVAGIVQGPAAPQGALYGPTPAHPVSGGTLTFASLTQPPSLDPFHQSADARIQWSVLMYQGLMYAGNGGTPVPLLASSVKESTDGLTYTFTLRKGITFSDGTPVTAADVQYSYNYLRNPKNGSPGADDFGAIGSISAPNASTVVFHLKSPDSALEATVTNKFGGVVPKGYFSRPGAQANLNKVSVGTGPYMLKKFVKNSELVLVKNPHYWGTGGYINTIQVEFLPSEAAIVSALQSGTVDMAELTLISDAKQALSNKNLRVQSFESMNHKVLDMNSAKAPLDKLKVRQAIASALSKTTIAQAAAPGAYTIIGTVPAGLQSAWGLPLNEVNFQNQNVSLAKKLMKQAGYPNGFKITLTTIDSYDWMDAASAVVIQELAAIGIKVTVQKMQLGNWIDAFDKNQLQFTFNDWPSPPDPDLFYYRHLHMPPQGSDFMNWNNKQGSELLDKARAASTTQQRKQLYDQFQKVLSDTVPWYMIYSPHVLVASSTRVHNAVLSPLGWQFGLAKAYLSK